MREQEAVAGQEGNRMMDTIIVGALIVLFLLLLAPAAFIPLLEDHGLTTDPKNQRAPRAIDTFPAHRADHNDRAAA
jgi:hypothetical protein